MGIVTESSALQTLFCSSATNRAKESFHVGTLVKNYVMSLANVKKLFPSHYRVDTLQEGCSVGNHHLKSNVRKNVRKYFPAVIFA